MAPTAVTIVPKPTGGIDPGVLEMLGKKASNMYLEKGVNLTDAVAKVASDEGISGRQFTTEHLRRITEFANTTTHQSLFTKSADKMFSFPLADPETVIQGLSNGAKHKIPVPSSRDAVEAAMPKAASITGYFPGVDTATLESFFKQATSETGEYPDHNPLGKLQILTDRLQAAEDVAMAKKASTELLISQVREELFNHIKQASLYGLSLKDLYSALSQATQNEKLAKAVLNDAYDKLKGEVYFQTREQSVKTASGSLQTDHPLVRSFKFLEKLSGQLQVLTKASATLSHSRVRAEQALRDRYRSL